MSSDGDIFTRNVELLKSTVNRQGVYGLIISLVTITTASLIISFQVYGEISLTAFLNVHEHNLAVRIMDFLPFLFTYWGQKVGYNIAYRAGEIILAETEDLREETTSWKEKSLHESTHDALTGLPNRVLFYETIRQSITSATHPVRPFTILFLDLDSFKEVNDIFGQAAGDQILKYLSTRIRRSIGGRDTLARMGGDEFALVLDAAIDLETGIDVARRIHGILSKPFRIEGRNIEISASIGVTHYPSHANDVDALIQCAEIASHSAKRTIVGYLVYSPELKQDNPRRLMLTSDLRKAIEGEQLALYYQPKVDIKSGTTVGAEALLRWEHQEFGQISPEEFIRLAERTRLISALTRMVIRKSVRQQQVWRNRGIDINLSLNITAQDLSDNNLPQVVGDLLAGSGINPSWLIFEITESTVMENADHALQVINQLADLRLRLSIDDFGTGYSSLAYLSRLPVHELKIDKSFVLGMHENRSDKLIVKATIDLGHSLGLKVTAEGIEDQQSWDTLKQLGCDLGQGYYLSPPLPENEFVNWLAESGRRKL